MVGVANRVRTIDGMPTMKVSSTPAIDDEQRDPTEPQVVAGERFVEEPRAEHEQGDAHAGPEPWDAHLHVDREGEHRQHQQHDGPGAGGQRRQAVAAEDGEHRADEAGHADAGGEELEDQQAARR